uniref:Sushi domain-containing protein n=1 Tax=Mesocestoides corti TaxID=53468 RepID=A0A5K3EIC5_MESCO
AHGREVSKGSAQIWIDRPVTADVVHFTCPESAIVRQYFSCNLTVESANMVHGKVTWEGQQSEDFTLSKSRSDFIGTPNLYSGPSLPDCRLTDAVITGTQAMYAGTISEIFITLKAPTRLKLFILRATCPANQIYDYKTDSCQIEGFKGVGCKDGESYCQLVRECVKVGRTNCSQTNRRNIKLDSSNSSTSIP